MTREGNPGDLPMVMVIVEEEIPEEGMNQAIGEIREPEMVEAGVTAEEDPEGIRGSNETGKALDSLKIDLP